MDVENAFQSKPGGESSSCREYLTCWLKLFGSILKLNYLQQKQPLPGFFWNCWSGIFQKNQKKNGHIPTSSVTGLLSFFTGKRLRTYSCILKVSSILIQMKRKTESKNLIVGKLNCQPFHCIFPVSIYPLISEHNQVFGVFFK